MVTARVLEFRRTAGPKPERLSPLAKKVKRLERVHPRGAQVIESLVDNLLRSLQL